MMTRFLTAFALMGFAAMVAFAAPAQASESTQISTHGSWAVYTFMENGNKVCYMAATPSKN